MASVVAAAAVPRRVALIMGVANHRSIAWACVQSFLNANFDCILTYQNERFEKNIQTLISKQELQQQQQETTTRGRILGSLPLDVTTGLPTLFDDQLASILKLDASSSTSAAAGRSSDHHRTIDAIVHSIAFANFERDQTTTTATADSSSSSSSQLLLHKASSAAFLESHHISAYSLLETARCAVSSGLLTPQQSSLTALSYLGAVRAVPNYHIMGPAKASLEAIVRGLAMELGQIQVPTATSSNNSNNTDNSTTTTFSIRVNAVSAGPLPTLAARGIPHFSTLYKSSSEYNALRRPITTMEVADTVRFLATDGTGITGQTIYVDGGYSSCLGAGSAMFPPPSAVE